MIRVDPQPEPIQFNATVRVPGERAIAEMVGKEPTPPRTSGRPFKQRVRKQRDSNGEEIKDANGNALTEPVTAEADLPPDEFPKYWTNALEDLMTSYKRICAYSCFFIHQVTGARSVDHMVPKSRSWDQVYEWENYRLCASLLNSRKKDFEDILDPFEIKGDWFELETVGFQIKAAAHVSDEIKAKIKTTIDRLKLNEYRFTSQREFDYDKYKKRDVSFRLLNIYSPFIAKEIVRLDLLNEEDKRTNLTQLPDPQRVVYRTSAEEE